MKNAALVSAQITPALASFVWFVFMCLWRVFCDVVIYLVRLHFVFLHQSETCVTEENQKICADKTKLIKGYANKMIDLTKCPAQVAPPIKLTPCTSFAKMVFYGLSVEDCKVECNRTPRCLGIAYLKAAGAVASRCLLKEGSKCVKGPEPDAAGAVFYGRVLHALGTTVASMTLPDGSPTGFGVECAFVPPLDTPTLAPPPAPSLAPAFAPTT
jgi:hypothetical protein